MKITNKVLIDLDGNPIKSGDLELTVANVLVNCALLPAENGRGYPAKEVAYRYESAIALNKLKVGEELDLPVELMSSLKADILRAYAPIIVGQLLPVVDGSH